MKFLLITGSYRSGTTFLYKAFQNNKDCSLLYQPSIKFFKILDEEIRKILKKKTFSDFPLGITKINKNLKLENIFLKKDQILKIVKDFIKLKDKNLNFYESLYHNIDLENKNINSRTYIYSLFKSIKQIDANNKKFYGIKEPFIGDILKLMINLEDLYIINLIRDPREIIFSRNYSILKNHNDFKDKKHPVILSSLICNRNMEADIHLSKKKRYLSLKFNELINNHRLVEKKLFKFLNLKVNLNLKKIKTNTAWSINSSGDSGNFGSNWKNNIKKNDLAIIEKICGKNFKRYGFKKEIDDQKYLSNYIKNFNEDPSKILKWTRKDLFLKYFPDKLKKL